MNKAELIDAIASGADISKVKAGEVIDAFVSTVTSALKKWRYRYFSWIWIFHNCRKSGSNWP